MMLLSSRLVLAPPAAQPLRTADASEDDAAFIAAEALTSGALAAIGRRFVRTPNFDNLAEHLRGSARGFGRTGRGAQVTNHMGG
jgi:hypothetical protein